jgi:protein-S-isoprenylcysteine O-methyltransferase Ste14
MVGAHSTSGGARVRIPPPLVFLASVIGGFVLRFVVAPPPLPFSRTVQLVVGAVLALAGINLAFWARQLMVASGQNPRPWTPKTSLLLQGPYRYTRNPMYVGMFLLQIGIGVMNRNLWVVVGAAVTLMIVHYAAVLPEEAYLDETFGEPYRDYKRTVRRYL